MGARAVRAVVSVAATVVSSLALVAALWWCADAFGPRSAAFAFLVTWLTMCWWGVVGRLYRVRLPAGWFAVRGWERGGRVWLLAGAGLYKAVLRRGPLALFNPGLHLPRERTPAALAALDDGMRHAETAHVVLFVIVLAVAGHALARGWWAAAGWTVLFDVLVNAGPVALQRYNRGWLERVGDPLR